MSEDTPKQDEPVLEVPDLSMVATQDLADELKRRSPDAFILHMESIEDGGRERFFRHFGGDWCRLVGVGADLTSYFRSRVRRLFPRPGEGDGE